MAKTSITRNLDESQEDFRRRYAREYAALNKERIRAIQYAYVERNREEVRARNRAWHAANPESGREANRRYRAKNPEGRRESHRAWARANPEHMRAAMKSWMDRNRGYLAFKGAERYHLVRRATPSWADKEAILAIYEEAARVSRETGIKHHVDHYFPIQGETVCGLHVPENLRVLTAFENISKGNRMPE